MEVAARVESLLDLPEELLTQVALQCATCSRSAALELCRLAASCHTFCRLVMCDAAAAALPWGVAMESDLDWHNSRHQPSPQLYRAMASIESAEWQEWDLATTRSLQETLLGRSSSASCRLGEALLMYGGTLNGNFGPLLDDLLELRLDGEPPAGQVTVRVVRELESRGEGDPGPRRGHTMTSTTLRGELVACILGGWSDGEVAMAPHLLHTSSSGAVGSAGATGGGSGGSGGGSGGSGGSGTAEASARSYSWSLPSVSGAPPAGRAFHSTTEIAPSALLMYGGLGTGCCRTDVCSSNLS